METSSPSVTPEALVRISAFAYALAQALCSRAASTASLSFTVNCTFSSGEKEFLSLSNNQFTVDLCQVFNPYGNVKDVDILISNRKFLGSCLHLY